MIVLHPLPRVTEISMDFDDDPRAAYSARWNTASMSGWPSGHGPGQGLRLFPPGSDARSPRAPRPASVPEARPRKDCIPPRPLDVADLPGQKDAWSGLRFEPSGSISAACTPPEVNSASFQPRVPRTSKRGP
jgi:hypothetical protein